MNVQLTPPKPATGQAPLADLPALVAEAIHDGPIWTYAGDQLNLNLLRFCQGDGVPPHRNDEVDVMILVVAGEGQITIDEERLRVAAGALVIIPRGAERSILARSAEFAYLSCHRRRGGLMPSFPARPAE